MRWLDEVAVLLRCASGLEAVGWWTVLGGFLLQME